MTETTTGSDVMTNEKDKDIAGGIIYQINKERHGHLMGDCAGEKCPDWITRQSEIISKALATARKEERGAAFKEAIEIVKGLAWTTTHDQMITALERALTGEAGKGKG